MIKYMKEWEHQSYQMQRKEKKQLFQFLCDSQMPPDSRVMREKIIDDWLTILGDLLLWVKINILNKLIWKSTAYE